MLRKTIGLSFMALMACGRLALAQNLPPGVQELQLPLPPIPFDENLKKLGINLFDCEFAKNTVSAHTTASAADAPFTLVCILSHKKENDQDPISSISLANVFVRLSADGTYGQQQTLSTAYPQFRGYRLVRSYTDGEMLFAKYVQNNERRPETIGLTTQLTNDYINPDVSTVMLVNQNAYPAWQYEFFYDLQKDPQKASQLYSGTDTEAVSNGYDEGYVVIHFAPEWGDVYDYRGFGKYRELFLESNQEAAPIVPIIVDHLDAAGHRINTRQVNVSIEPGTRNVYGDFELWPMSDGKYAVSLNSLSVYENSPIDSSYTLVFFDPHDNVDHQATVKVEADFTLKTSEYLIPEKNKLMRIDHQGNILLLTTPYDPDGMQRLDFHDTNGQLIWQKNILLEKSRYQTYRSLQMRDLLETEQGYLALIEKSSGSTNNRNEWEGSLLGVMIDRQGKEVWRLPLLNRDQLKMADRDTPLRFSIANNKLWIKLDEEVKTLSATAWQKILTSKGLLSENLGLHIYTVDLPK